MVENWVVVVPSFNHADDAIACLGSVWSARPRPGRIVLVDDASTDGAVQRIVAWAESAAIPVHVEREAAAFDAPLASGLTIVVAEKNQGFTLTSNAGLACARNRTAAPFVLLLNNDAVVSPSFFAELASAVEQNPSAGLVSGTIYEWDGTTVWYAGGWIKPLRALAGHVTTPGTAEPHRTEWVSGCTMLISREALKTVGMLSACFSPYYSEDVDYSLRARAAGFEVLVAPRASARHRVGSSLGKPAQQRPEVTYVAHRNRVFVVRRHYRGWRRAAAFAYLAIGKPLRAIVDTLRGRPRTAWAALTGTVDGLLNSAARE